jgi:hypothetical protein
MSSGFSVQRNGFVKVGDIIGSVITDLEANGFTLKFPAVAPINWASPYKVTLEAGSTVDPLATTQKWRIQFTVIDDFQCKMYVAADLQLPDDGSVAKLNVDFNTAVDNAGVIGTDLVYPYKLDGTTLIVPDTPYNASTPTTLAMVQRSKRINNADSQFIDRSIRIPDLATAANYPMSYLLNVTPRGFSLCIWEEAQDITAGQNFSWVVVQRPVDRTTGQALVDTATKCPLFCVYGLQDMYVPAAIKPKDSADTNGHAIIIYPERWESGIKKFVVRESDVVKPTPSMPATYDSVDSNGIMNAGKQVTITEDNKYVVTFPNKLNTYRYAYTQELDLVGYTSASVIAQYAKVPLTVYGESSARTYQAMLANGINNTKMRVLFLTNGGGIS